MPKRAQRRVLDVRVQSGDPEVRSLLRGILWILGLIALLAVTTHVMVVPLHSLTIVPGARQHYFQSDEDMVRALRVHHDGECTPVDWSLVDWEVSPSRDLYGHACGRYQGVGVRGPDMVRAHVQTVLDTVMARAPEHSKIGTFYRACRAYVARDQRQVEAEWAVAAEHSRYLDDHLHTLQDLGTVMGHLARYDIPTPIQPAVALDHDQEALLTLHQWGGVFPDTRSPVVRLQVVGEVLARTFPSASAWREGLGWVRNTTADILDIEHHLDQCRTQGHGETLTLPDFVAATRESTPFAWEDFWSELFDGVVPPLSRVQVHTPHFFRCIDWRRWGVAQWRDYLRFSIHHTVQELRPRGRGGYCFRCSVPWDRPPEKRIGPEEGCRAITAHHLSFVLDNYWLALTDVPDVHPVVERVRALFLDAVARAPALSPAGRANATAWLRAVVVHAGAPPQWPMSRADLRVSEHHVDTVVELRRYHVREALDMVRGVRAPSSLFDGSVTDTAPYYHRGLNQVFLPAALLQPPFHHPRYNDTVTMATLGTTIGREFARALDSVPGLEGLCWQGGESVVERGVEGAEQRRVFRLTHAQLWCGRLPRQERCTLI